MCENLQRCLHLIFDTPNTVSYYQAYSTPNILCQKRKSILQLYDLYALNFYILHFIREMQLVYCLYIYRMYLGRIDILHENDENTCEQLDPK